jgi:hypothetical protein
MGWRRIVHKLTNRCMARTFTFQKGEVVVKFSTSCDGEALDSAGLFRFGTCVAAANADEGDDVLAVVNDWLADAGP